MMTRKTKIAIIIIALFLLLMAIVFEAWSLSPSWECRLEETCHVIMQQDSETYINCVQGSPSLEQGSSGAWSVTCEYGAWYRTVAPIIYKGD